MRKQCLKLLHPPHFEQRGIYRALRDENLVETCLDRYAIGRCRFTKNLHLLKNDKGLFAKFVMIFNFPAIHLDKRSH